MNEKLKKRLIGAVVLVALAAIFIPMLFNGGERTEMPTFGSNVPPKPDEDFRTIEVPLQLPAEEEIAARPITSEEEAAAFGGEEGDPPNGTKGESAEAVPATPEAAAEPAPAAAPPAPAAAPKATDPKPASGWVVQLGSFGSSTNALALRDKARKKGFAAFVEQQSSASGKSYRVRIGPELKRESADALKARLEKAGFKGVVMPHP